MAFEHDYKKKPELTNTEMEQLQFTSPHKQITENFQAKVIKVHDGDTVTLRTNFRDFDFPLRMLDIDAKELNEGGKEAQQFVEERILNEEVKIIINKDNRVGKYGRLLGYIFHRGMNLSQELIHLGLAVPFGKKKEGEPIEINKLFSLKQWF